ncbi:MAG: hypothetical protein HKL96_08850 [Phycisphaerales bacterium]|nr:hypothetical protein [Phycisphaerales bacterium]
MIQVLYPMWFALPAAIACIGAVLLWRTAGRPIETATLRFWPAAAGSQGVAWRRRIEPWSILVLLGAILSALALPRMDFVQMLPAKPPAPVLKMLAAGRSTGRGHPVQIYLRAIKGIRPQSQYVMQVASGTARKELHFSGNALLNGVILHGLSPRSPLPIHLIAAGHTVWSGLLVRHVSANITIRYVGPPPPAIVRFAKVADINPSQSGGGSVLWVISRMTHQPVPLQPGDVVLLLGPAIGLLHRDMRMTRLSVAPQTRPLMVTPGRVLHAISQKSLGAVHVMAFWYAPMGSQWQTLLETAGKPWLMEREDMAREVEWFALASPLSKSYTDWPQHSSFVIFMANILRDMRRGPVGAMAPRNWKLQESVHPTRPPRRIYRYAFNPWLEFAAILAFVAAAVAGGWRIIR